MFHFPSRGGNSKLTALSFITGQITNVINGSYTGNCIYGTGNSIYARQEKRGRGNQEKERIFLATVSIT